MQHLNRYDWVVLQGIVLELEVGAVTERSGRSAVLALNHCTVG
jgi:hypothetical protein